MKKFEFDTQGFNTPVTKLDVDKKSSSFNISELLQIFNKLNLSELFNLKKEPLVQKEVEVYSSKNFVLEQSLREARKKIDAHKQVTYEIRNQNIKK